MLAFFPKNRFQNPSGLRRRCGVLPLGLGLVLLVAACDDGRKKETAAPQTSAQAELEGGFAGRYLAGRHAAITRDFTAAADFMAAALAYDPENADLLRRTFYLMADEGRFEEADRLAERVLVIEPEDPIAGFYRMARSFRAGNPATALDDLEKMPRRGLNAYLQPLFSGWIHFALDDGEKAVEALGRLARAEDFQTIYRYHLALLYDLEGKDDAAEDNYKLALGDHPPSLRVIEALGNFYERHNRREEAHKLYGEYVSDDSPSLLLIERQERLAGGKPPERLIGSAAEGLAEAFFNLAGLLQQQGAHEFALVAARLAMDLRADFYDVHMLVAEIYEAQERYRAAIHLSEQIPSETAWGWLAQLRIARNYDLLNEEKKAILLLKGMAKKRPERIDAPIELGTLLRMREQYGEAIVAYDEAIKRIKKVAPRHWTIFYARGIAFEQSGKWEKAEADLLRALQLQPDQPYVLNYLGYSWLEHGQQLDRARRYIERAVELRPDDGYIVDSLGWALYRTGAYEEALPHLERAVELRPNDPIINDHLGDVYWQVGRRYEARFQWKRALTFNADPKLGENIQTKLESGLPEKDG